MRMLRYPWSVQSLLLARPTVGALMDLCEENYRHLLRLAPQMRLMAGRHHSQVEGHVDLHLEVLEQAPYTTLIHLTYYFDPGSAGALRPDPDAVLRVYHDAGQAEVLDLAQQSLPLRTLPGLWSLDQKWNANLFLSKWLLYCIAQGHRFRHVAQMGAEVGGEPVELV